jgi:hypothetical protein
MHTTHSISPSCTPHVPSAHHSHNTFHQPIMHTTQSAHHAHHTFHHPIMHTTYSISLICTPHNPSSHHAHHTFHHPIMHTIILSDHLPHQTRLLMRHKYRKVIPVIPRNCDCTCSTKERLEMLLPRSLVMANLTLHQICEMDCILVQI